VNHKYLTLFNLFNLRANDTDELDEQDLLLVVNSQYSPFIHEEGKNITDKNIT
jgi:hypothetical protein